MMNCTVKIDNHNGQYVVSSRVIAKELGKRHTEVLRSLDNILKRSTTQICVLFIKSEYKASNGKINKEYLITKDGFTLYMFNIQGYNEFKMAYIDQFNKMEKALKNKEMITLKKQLTLMDKKQSETELCKERIKILSQNYEELYREINDIYNETEKQREAVSNSNRKINQIFVKLGVNLRESKAILEKLEVASKRVD